MLRKTRAFHDNMIDPYIPEWWGQETLAILYERMIAANFVNRDYDKYFNKFGDVVNTRRPRELTPSRKVKGDAVPTQDLQADNVQITLDQWVVQSFFVDDIEEVMSMKKLSDEYALPAAKGMARMVDKIILGQYPRFLPNMAGKLQGFTGSNAKDYVIDLRQVLDDSKCPEDGRNLILNSATEGDMLRPEWFTSADKVGDAGTALRTASLGTKLGFDFFKDLNMAKVTAGNTVRTFAINNSAGYSVGDTALTIDTGTGDITPGTWVAIDGMPYQVASRTGTAPTTAIVLTYGLKRAVANDVSVTVYTPGAVNNAVGYAAGYNKTITVDGFTVAPRVGQFVSFGSDTNNVYCIIDVSGLTTITLDRSLVQGIADNDTVNIGPAGNYNLCINKDAITIAIRALEPIKTGTGAISTVVSDPDGKFSIRVTISYDPNYQRTRWTMDFLLGIQILDDNLGAVLLA